MRVLNEFIKDDKKSLIKSDGGSYYVEMYISDELKETKHFNEHTLRIVENYAKEWIDNAR